MSFLDLPAPRWVTIGAHRPFLADLAKGLLEALGAEGLAEAAIMLPTRRSARALAEAFLAAAPGRALLLPQIRALGDLDEDEAPFEPGDLAAGMAPAIGAWRRRFELAGLVVEHQDIIGRKLNAALALEMADALGRFLDACQIEEIVEPDMAAAMAEAELARHWEVSARFLGLVLTAWPVRLAAIGVMDIWQRRVALLRALGERWRDDPPDRVTVVAGSTGTTPAAAELIIAIGNAPRGCVVLPGLDKSLAERAWSGADEQHPQGALRRLIDKAALQRGDIADWNGAAETSVRGRWRRRVVGEALRPPEETDDWLGQIKALREEGAGRDPIAEGLEGLVVIAARDEEEEARMAALLMREALETPGRTCALVSPDQGLARRVSALLSRWAITVDSSAGRPLALSPIAVLLSLVARTSADPVAPATLLAILKHPLARLGLASADLARRRDTLERVALRGPRARDWSQLEARLGDDKSDANDLLDRLRVALSHAHAPHDAGAASASGAARGLAEACEDLAKGPPGGGAFDAGELWAGLAGERAAALIASVIEETAALPPVTARGFSEFLDELLEAEAVPSGAPGHPRLKILGVLEARLISADLVILAGLEEGVWPQAAPIDPFLSRPMRASLGLPAPERRIGLSAHDFAQAAAASEVAMLHAERRGGAPAVQSRWLWRLQTLAKGAGAALPSRPDVVAWARALDAPIARPPAHLATAACPRPAPPLASRPRKMAVTTIERWVRDPYAIYARYILRLRPLERPDQAIGARERGSAVHRAFERFTLAFPEDLPADAEAQFEALLLAELHATGMDDRRMGWEAARARRTASWVADLERARRPATRLVVERGGEVTFAAEGGPFTLTARADRIEVRGETADILDFKTGEPPTKPQIVAGLAPQLTLTGAVMMAGGFPDLGRLEPGELVYVRIGGGRNVGSVITCAAPPESTVLAETALAGLKRRIAAFDNPMTAYPSHAIPMLERFAGDYDHLARVWEWRVIGGSEGEDA